MANCSICGADFAELGCYCTMRDDRQPEPTTEEICGSYGHKYYGDEGDRGRCYCGQQEYPQGGT